MAYIPIEIAVVHELGHTMLASIQGLHPSRICWLDIYSYDRPDGTKDCIMHGIAASIVDNVRVETTPGKWEFRPELTQELLLVAAAGVAAEILAEGQELNWALVNDRFAHTDQDGDRAYMRELLGRDATKDERFYLSSKAANKIAPAMPAILRESARIVEVLREQPYRFTGVIFEMQLSEIVHRIVSAS